MKIVIGIAAISALTGFRNWTSIVGSIATATLFVVACILRFYIPKEEHVVKEAQQKKFQFSLARLLLATSGVATVFGIFKATTDFKPLIMIFPATVLSFSLGGLILVCMKKDLKTIVGLIAMFLGMSIILGLVFIIMDWFR